MSLHWQSTRGVTDEHACSRTTRDTDVTTGPIVGRSPMVAAVMTALVMILWMLVCSEVWKGLMQ